MKYRDRISTLQKRIGSRGAREVDTVTRNAEMVEILSIMERISGELDSVIIMHMALEVDVLKLVQSRDNG